MGTLFDGCKITYCINCAVHCKRTMACKVTTKAEAIEGSPFSSTACSLTLVGMEGSGGSKIWKVGEALGVATAKHEGRQLYVAKLCSSKYGCTNWCSIDGEDIQ